MKKLQKIEDPCAVVALLYVSGKDEETVLRVCRLRGFNKKKRGMDDDDWKKAATDLKIEIRGIETLGCTLKKFITSHDTGLFLLRTCDHLFCLDNGLIIDPLNKYAPGLNRRIINAWKVYVDDQNVAS